MRDTQYKILATIDYLLDEVIKDTTASKKEHLCSAIEKLTDAYWSIRNSEEDK